MLDQYDQKYSRYYDLVWIRDWGKRWNDPFGEPVQLTDEERKELEVLELQTNTMFEEIMKIK